MRPDLAGAEGFIRNSWYVAGRSENFGRSLSAVRMLGEEIVVYRDTTGKSDRVGGRMSALESCRCLGAH